MVDDVLKVQMSVRNTNETGLPIRMLALRCDYQAHKGRHKSLLRPSPQAVVWP